MAGAIQPPESADSMPGYHPPMAHDEGRRDRIIMDITLPPELVRFVEAKVGEGTYASPSDVVQDGLRLLLEQERQRISDLREAVRIGLEQARRGEVVPGDEVFDRLEKKLEDRKRSPRKK